MEVSKLYGVSTDYKDRRFAPNWESLLVVDVVFVDQTTQGSPVLYLLKDKSFPVKEAFDVCQVWASLPHFSRDSFVSMGEVLFIDKKKKQISLSNKNIIAYNYLVIASNSKTVMPFHDREFAAGLQALIDALRVKSKIPSSFAPYLKGASPSKSDAQQSKQSIQHLTSEDIAKIVHPYISFSSSNQLALELSAFRKRLYQVQI